MLKNKRISVVIPCKNEEKGIAAVIKNIPSYVDEIIVVDNGSTDKTAEVAKKAGAIVLNEPRKMNGIGYGYAHITGIKHATGDYVATVDGDDTYPAYQIKEIVEKMESDKIDFMSCNRLPLNNPKAISKTRQLGILILNLEVLLLYGTRVKDILTGMWIMKKPVFYKLNLRMGDWNLSPEIKISAIFNKHVNFGEYHIDHFAREKEPSKQAIWNTGFNHLAYILKRRFTQDSIIGNALFSRLVWQKDLFRKASSSSVRFLI
jgi:glycosyltransferase involved in cell wall biosynthesis